MNARRNGRQLFSFLVIVFCFFIQSHLIANADEVAPKSPLDRIENSYRAGEIGLDESLILKVKAILAPETLPNSLRAPDFPRTVLGRKFTSLLTEIRLSWKSLRKETRELLLPLLLRPTDASYIVFGTEYAYTAPVFTHDTTHFKIHYVKTSADAPDPADGDADGTPDYVETMGTEFETVYTNETTTMGYDVPPSDVANGGDSRFDVYIKNIGGDGLFGWADPEGSSSGNSWFSFMVMDIDYSAAEFSPGTNGIDALKVTAAHEFHHAVQFGYNVNGDSWFKETTSTWIEDEVYDPINDNLQYMPSWFGSPETSLDVAGGPGGLHEYGSWIFARYLSEKHGSGTLKDIWDKMKTAPSALNGIGGVLTDKGTNFEEAFPEFTAKNHNKTWYEEGATYPDIKIANAASPHNSYPLATQTTNLDHLASGYYKFIPDPGETEKKTLRIKVNGPDGVACGAYAKPKEGGTFAERKIFLDPITKDGKICIPDFGPGGVEEVILILSNASTSSDAQVFSWEADYECNPLDLIFCIDTTGSMFDDIDAVKASATELVTRIDGSDANYRIALVDYRDHPDGSCGAVGVDYVYNVDLGWSDDPAAIVAAINSLSLGNGADFPESVFAALKRAINTEGLGSGWRDGVKKVLILMGDAPPHDPDCSDGTTHADVVAAAFAVDPASIYPILVGSDTSAASFFSTLAEDTGGEMVEAATADDVVSAMLSAIGDILVACGTTTNYAKGKSFVKFNHKKPSKDKALIRMCVDQDFCDAIAADPAGVELVVSLDGCDPITISGLKPNKSGTKYRAKSASGASLKYLLEINCKKKKLRFLRKKADLDCVANQVECCVTITDGPCLCSEAEFEKKENKEDPPQTKKLSLKITTDTCTP